MADGAERPGNVAGKAADIGALGDMGGVGDLLFLPGTGRGPARFFSAWWRGWSSGSVPYLMRQRLPANAMIAIEAWPLPTSPSTASRSPSPYRGGILVSP